MMAGLFRWQAVVSRLFLFAMFLAVSFLTLSLVICYAGKDLEWKNSKSLVELRERD
jgi:hypothetical protein